MFRTCFPFRGIPTLVVATVLGAAASAAAWEYGGPLYAPNYPDCYPPSHYGFNLDDQHPGYFGGGNYREYYNYGRGYGVANFPGPLPYNPYGPSPLCFRLGPPPPVAPAVVYPAAPVVEAPAYLEMHVPAEAELWIEGVKTKQVGSSRTFQSPALTPGAQYGYEIRARWQVEGRPMEQTRKLLIHAGDRLTVRFPNMPEGEMLPAPGKFPLEAGLSAK